MGSKNTVGASKGAASVSVGSKNTVGASKGAASVSVATGDEVATGSTDALDCTFEDSGFDVASVEIELPSAAGLGSLVAELLPEVSFDVKLPSFVPIPSS